MQDFIKKQQTEFNRSYKELDELYHMMAVWGGISDSVFTILYGICELGDGCRQKDICDMAYTSKQTINSSIRNLERDGVLRLEDGKGRDRHIYMTAKGKELLEEKVLPVVQAENAVFQELSEEEGKQLLRLMQKYRSILRKNLYQIIGKGDENK